METAAHPPVALSLLVEARAASVVAELRAAGVDALLLKGTSNERWLYDADEVRPSGDVDLLVAPSGLERAERRLQALGFVNKYDGVSPSWAEEHADVWEPADGLLPVDLHRRLWGVGASAADAWARLWAGREPLELGGARVEVPGEAARALLVALHAAHHGPEHRRPSEDLARAVRRLEPAVWQEAASLARELSAEAGLAAGLAQAPGGAEVRDRLGLPPADREAVVQVARLWSAPATTAGFLRVLDAGSARERWAVLARELVPSRRFMRSDLARRGRTSRAGAIELAYVQRWASLGLDAPRGLRAARALRRR